MTCRIKASIFLITRYYLFYFELSSWDTLKRLKELVNRTPSPRRCVGGPSYASCTMAIESSVVDGNEWRRSENQCAVSKKESSMPFSRRQRNGPLSQRTPATDSQLRKVCPIVGEGQTLFTTVSRRENSCRRPHWALLLWLPWMTTMDYINFHPPFYCQWVFWQFIGQICDLDQCLTYPIIFLWCVQKCVFFYMFILALGVHVAKVKYMNSVRH